MKMFMEKEEDLQIQWIEPEKLKFFENNLNVINSTGIRMLEESVKTNGFLMPLIVSKEDNVVLDGNHRLAVSLDIGIKKLPCLIVNANKNDYMNINIQFNMLKGYTNTERLIGWINSEIKTGETVENISKKLKLNPYWVITLADLSKYVKYKNFNGAYDADEIVQLPVQMHKIIALDIMTLLGFEKKSFVEISDELGEILIDSIINDKFMIKSRRHKNDIKCILENPAKYGLAMLSELKAANRKNRDSESLINKLKNENIELKKEIECKRNALLRKEVNNENRNGESDSKQNPKA